MRHIFQRQLNRTEQILLLKSESPLNNQRVEEAQRTIELLPGVVGVSIGNIRETEAGRDGYSTAMVVRLMDARPSTELHMATPDELKQLLTDGQEQFLCLEYVSSTTANLKPAPALGLGFVLGLVVGAVALGSLSGKRPLATASSVKNEPERA